VIKAQYCYFKKIGPSQTLVLKALSYMFLDLQMSLFKLTMKNNVALTMDLHYAINPIVGPKLA